MPEQQVARDFMEGSISGDPGGARTPNPQFRRLMLYPIELRGHDCNCGLWNRASLDRTAEAAVPT